MVRTVHQMNAYCEHELKRGTPVDEIIVALVTEGMSQEQVRQGLAVAMKRAKKPALVMIAAGIILALLGSGISLLGLSAGLLYIWPFFPIIVGVILLCIGSFTFLAVPSMKSKTDWGGTIN